MQNVQLSLRSLFQTSFAERSTFFFGCSFGCRGLGPGVAVGPAGARLGVAASGPGLRLVPLASEIIKLN